MTGLYYIVLELVKFSITLALRHVPRTWTHGKKIKAKDYVIFVELSKLLLVLLTVLLVPYVAPTLTGETVNTSNQTEVQQ